MKRLILVASIGRGIPKTIAVGMVRGVWNVLGLAVDLQIKDHLSYADHQGNTPHSQMDSEIKENLILRDCHKNPMLYYSQSDHRPNLPLYVHPDCT